MKKRNVINKPPQITCQICNKQVSQYSMASHIKWSHQLSSDEYESKYGRFRKKKIKKKRKSYPVKCKICKNEYATVGMFGHLRDTHHMTIDQYVTKYGDFRKRNFKIDERFTCLVCECKNVNGHALTHHLKNIHELDLKTYILDFVFKNGIPKCKCGCGQEVNILLYYSYHRNYIDRHPNDAMRGKRHKKSSRDLMRKKRVEYMKLSDKVNTKPERKFKAILESLNVSYEHQKGTDSGLIDFYLPEQNWYVEIDGEYWHPIKKDELAICHIPGSITEKRKYENIKNLYRIGSLDVSKIKSLEDIPKFHRSIDFNLDYYQKILTKEYLRQIIENREQKYLKYNVRILLDFIREYQPTFPYPPQTKQTKQTKQTEQTEQTEQESISEIIEKIQAMDLTKLYDPNTRTFRNNCSVAGVRFLKSHFRSYWNARRNGSKSPVEAWMDDNLMRKVISYRIGLNNSNEVFDFSLHQLVRGLSARFISVSFFKPVLASAIYKYFLGNCERPVVIDPCAGFGGRMLGFKAVYPKGTYIGIEPNQDTFTELSSLAMNFENVELHNCKAEDYQGKVNADLTFTSVPYFNTEIYSQHVRYDSFEHWKSEFFDSLNRFTNLKVNVPFEYENGSDYRIGNSSSHFSNQMVKQAVKYEYIV